MGKGGDAVLGELDRHLFGAQKRGVLQRQRIVGFGQDTHEILFGQRAQFDPDRQTTLKFRQQIRGFGNMERAAGDEQHVVGLDRPVFGGNGRAFDQRQQIALHAFAADIGASRVRPGANLVDLIQKHDAVLFDRLDRGAV